MINAYDFNNKIIDIPVNGDDIARGFVSVLVQDLLSDIRQAESTSQGMAYGKIADASGGESLGGTVAVGITVNLLDSWQVRFGAGNYIAKIYGGNLVGGLNGDPVAYSNGVQVLLLQSASSTMVATTTGSGLSSEQDSILRQALSAAAAASAYSSAAVTQATKARQMQTNKAIISGDGQTVSIYEDDGATLLHVFTVSADKKTRTPQ